MDTLPNLDLNSNIILNYKFIKTNINLNKLNIHALTLVKVIFQKNNRTAHIMKNFNFIHIYKFNVYILINKK